MTKNNLTAKNPSHTQELLNHLLTVINEDGGLTYNLFNQLTKTEFVNSFTETVLNYRALSLAIVEMNKKNKNKLTDFCDSYLRLAKDETTNNCIEKDWSFFIPFLADVDHAVKLPFTIKILGHKFEFTSKVQYKSKLKIDPQDNRHEYSSEINESVNSSKAVFIKCKSSGIDSWSAWSKISLSYDVLRGVLEFTINYFSTSLFQNHKQRSKIHHPNWILSLSNDRQFSVLKFLTDNQEQTFKYKFTRKTYKALANNSKIVSKAIQKKSSVELLVSSLRLYADALSVKYNHNQLLGLWQVAETLTLSNEVNGSTKDVVSRLIWFSNDLKLLGSGYRYTLQAIGDKRNKIVHEGISDISDDDVDFLKIAVEHTLLWFFHNLSHLKTIKHVSEFYRLKDIGNSDINAIKDILKFVSKKRQT